MVNGEKYIVLLQLYLGLVSHYEEFLAVKFISYSFTHS